MSNTEKTTVQRFLEICPGDILHVDGVQGDLWVDTDQPTNLKYKILLGEKGEVHMMKLGINELKLEKYWGKIYGATITVEHFNHVYQGAFA